MFERFVYAAFHFGMALFFLSALATPEKADWLYYYAMPTLMLEIGIIFIVMGVAFLRVGSSPPFPHKAVAVLLLLLIALASLSFINLEIRNQAQQGLNADWLFLYFLASIAAKILFFHSKENAATELRASTIGAISLGLSLFATVGLFFLGAFLGMLLDLLGSSLPITTEMMVGMWGCLYFAAMAYFSVKPISWLTDKAQPRNLPPH